VGVISSSLYPLIVLHSNKNAVFPLSKLDESEIKQLLGLAIRDIRIQKGFSQEKVAELAGLHRTFMGNLERGVHSVSIYNLYLISNALGVKPSEILDRMYHKLA